MEEVLAKRCHILSEMTETIKSLTKYYWLSFLESIRGVCKPDFV